MQKRTYYIPTIEIIKVETERLMELAGISNKAHMPARREKAF